MQKKLWIRKYFKFQFQRGENWVEVPLAGWEVIWIGLLKLVESVCECGKANKEEEVAEDLLN